MQAIPINQVIVGDMLPKFRIAELEAKIKKEGITEETAPVVVRQEDGSFILKHGLVTYKIALDLGMTEIPCIIVEKQ